MFNHVLYIYEIGKEHIQANIVDRDGGKICCQFLWFFMLMRQEILI